MLEMRSVCERCGAALLAAERAFICSFECTFCSACAGAMGRCPNCGGELVPRPKRRPKGDRVEEVASTNPASPDDAPPVSTLRAREATAGDAAAIASIYNDGIADRVATFETRPRTAEDVAGWLGGRYPVIVVEDGAAIVAFASMSQYRPRACYAHIAEFSVYVARAHRGHGAGRAALTALFERARAAGFGKLVSRVFFDNVASRSLLAKLGFREVGTYEKHGQLDGAWRDVVIVEKLL